MAAPTPSGFVYGDFLERVLPVLLAAFLFTPYVAAALVTEHADVVFFAAIIIGYVFHGTFTLLAKWWLERTPFRSRRQKKEFDQVDGDRAWLGKNWDLARMSYLVDKDDREYLYQTASWAEFYRHVAFFLQAYLVLNLIVFVASVGVILVGSDSVTAAASAVLTIPTPLVGGQTVPAVIAIPIVWVLSFHNFDAFVLQYRLLFAEGLQHDIVSQRLHSEGAALAKSIWGRGTDPNKPIAGATVVLRIEGQNKYETTTDTHGRFQFVDVFRECVGHFCEIELSANGVRLRRSFRLAEATVPCFDVKPTSAS